jgi:hypothetical protein
MGLSNGFVVSKGSKISGRVEDGTHVARVQGIVDLGIQKSEWKGEIKDVQKVFITFEFPTERIEVDGVSRPRWLSKEYTVSNHEKSALFSLLKAIDPDGKVTNKGRNVKALLGLPVMVEVGSTETGNAKVVNTIKLMKGMVVDALENPTTFFDIDRVDITVWNRLPKWLQEKIQGGVGFDPSVISKASLDGLDSADDVENPY